MMKKISLRLDTEVHNRIKQKAKSENKSMNAVMVCLIEQYIAQNYQNDSMSSKSIITE